MAAFRQDLVYTLRRLSRSRGLAITVVLSIGLGIAANATIFSIVSRFVLAPPPVGDPGTLMALHTTHDGDVCCNNFPYPVYTDLRDRAKSFSGIAAYYELVPASVGGAGEPERVWGQSAIANFFDVGQIPMAVGRGFHADEEKQYVIVLGYRLWQRRFGGDRGVVGRTVMISGKPFTVVGVAEPAFHGMDQILDPEFWIPLGHVEDFSPGLPSRTSRDGDWLAVIARLKPGATHSEAAAELETLAKDFAVAYPDTDKGVNFRFEQAGSLPPRDRGTILMFFGSAAGGGAAGAGDRMRECVEFVLGAGGGAAARDGDSLVAGSSARTAAAAGIDGERATGAGRRRIGAQCWRWGRLRRWERFDFRRRCRWICV